MSSNLQNVVSEFMAKHNTNDFKFSKEEKKKKDPLANIEHKLDQIMNKICNYYILLWLFTIYFYINYYFGSF